MNLEKRVTNDEKVIDSQTTIETGRFTEDVKKLDGTPGSSDDGLEGLTSNQMAVSYFVHGSKERKDEVIRRDE
jgi:hypothetical protein